MSGARLQERTAEIATADGKMRTFVAWPDGAGSYPVVLLYMDSVGFREELRDFARRFAANGYCALLPDLYYRIGGISFDPHEPWLQSDRTLAGRTRTYQSTSDVGYGRRVGLAADICGSRARPQRLHRVLHGRPHGACRRRHVS